MAWTSWPFDFEPDGVTPQETTEASFSATLRAAMQDGVGSTADLVVGVFGDSTAITLTPGYGHVQGYSCHGDTQTQVPAPENGATQPRRYWVVLRLDRAARQVVPAVVEGTASSSPQLPVLTRNAAVFEEPLASFRRAGSAGPITDLVDYRAVVNPTGGRLVSSTARPPYPAAGERIYETDTGRELYWHAGAWRVAADPSYPTPWQPLTLGATMSWPGHGQHPEWRWDAPGVARLRGRVRRTNGDPIGHLSYVARLPVALRPDEPVGAVVPAQRGNAGTTVRVEISATSSDAGRIFVWLPGQGGYDPNWIELNMTYTV